MIQVDSRTGSKELLDYFPVGTAELAQLDAADFSFLGTCAGEPVLVGVERMTLRDFVNKVWSGRLYNVQVPKLIASYNYVYVVIEGSYQSSRGYVSTHGKRLKGGNSKEIKYQQLQCMLYTLVHTTPVRLLQTDNERDTVCVLLSLEYWWKDSALHTSNKKIYAPQPVTGGRQLYATRLIHQVARQLPGIGDSKVVEVATHFKSVSAMINATAKEWQELDGVGKVTAERIVKAIKEKV